MPAPPAHALPGLELQPAASSSNNRHHCVPAAPCERQAGRVQAAGDKWTLCPRSGLLLGAFMFSEETGKQCTGSQHFSQAPLHQVRAIVLSC